MHLLYTTQLHIKYSIETLVVYEGGSVQQLVTEQFILRAVESACSKVVHSSKAVCIAILQVFG